MHMRVHQLRSLQQAFSFCKTQVNGRMEDGQAVLLHELFSKEDDVSARVIVKINFFFAEQSIWYV